MAGMAELGPSDGQQLDEGHLNSVVRHAGSVRKAYLGTLAAGRRAVELISLTHMAGHIPVPVVLPGGGKHTLAYEFVDGLNGQRLIRDGQAGLALRLCGAVLRRLQAVDASALKGILPGTGDVIVHGDFGPQNVLIRPAQHDVSAVIDWEFCHLGHPIEDLAWAEWTVRRHYRYALGFLPELFAGYGHEPGWAERRKSMLSIREVALWAERIADTAAWGRAEFLAKGGA
jgi:hypothetical protein